VKARRRRVRYLDVRQDGPALVVRDSDDNSTFADVPHEEVTALILRGHKAHLSNSTAGAASAAKARAESRAQEWLAEVERRPLVDGVKVSRESVYGRIARRVGLKPGSVKAAVLRLEKHRT